MASAITKGVEDIGVELGIFGVGEGGELVERAIQNDSVFVFDEGEHDTAFREDGEGWVLIVDESVVPGFHGRRVGEVFVFMI